MLEISKLIYVTFKILWTLLFWPFFIFIVIGAIGGILTLTFQGMIKVFSYITNRIVQKSKKSENKSYYEKTDSKNEDIYHTCTSTSELDPYTVLGIKIGTSTLELKKAYKNKIMTNHPDKLSTLDPELQQIASERTIKIKEAYKILTN